MKFKKPIFIIVTAALLLVSASIFSLQSGFTEITLTDTIGVFFGPADTNTESILLGIRLPRILAAVLSGAALALSGVMLQSVMQNSLADSGIIGINSGAGLFVVLVLFLLEDFEYSLFIIPVAAFTGGLLVAIIVLFLSYRNSIGVKPIRLILNGIAVGAGVSALMIVLSLLMSHETYQFAAGFLAGTIWGTSWAHVWILAAGLILFLPVVSSKISIMNILRMDTLNAVSLGVNLKKERLILLVCAVGLASASVSVSGAIAFVGLIAPHLSRRLVGAGHKFVLPLSALSGGLLVLLADTIGRTLFFPAALPAGVIVAIIGAPYFIYLLMTTDA
ncbi:MAG TPA: iron ABC transporter permease [Candidatus Salinicoccus merdavium]|nr:iron ABC transporter permease [Candidatus Salinicoccus merdavium]